MAAKFMPSLASLGRHRQAARPAGSLACSFRRHDYTVEWRDVRARGVAVAHPAGELRVVLDVLLQRRAASPTPDRETEFGRSRARVTAEARFDHVHAVVALADALEVSR